MMSMFEAAMGRVQSENGTTQDVAYLNGLATNPMTSRKQARAASAALRNGGYVSDGKAFLKAMRDWHNKKDNESP